MVNYDDKLVKKIIKTAIKQSIKDLDNTPAHKLDKSNPNHPDYNNKLFGYDEKEFLNKQYK